MKGEADIAIRMTDNHEYRVPENLLGLRLPDVHVHAYAGTKIAARIKKGVRPEGIGWMKWDKRINFEKMRTHFDKVGIPVTLVIDDIKAQVDAAKSGVGLAILPCFLGDSDKGLKLERFLTNQLTDFKSRHALAARVARKPRQNQWNCARSTKAKIKNLIVKRDKNIYERNI